MAGDPRRTVALLEEAAGWAEAIGLRPEAQVYFGWGACARQQLAFFHDRWDEAEAVLATHYARPSLPATGAQLDIFLDSGATVALPSIAFSRLRAD